MFKKFSALTLSIIMALSAFTIVNADSAVQNAEGDLSKLVFSSDEAWSETVTNTTVISNNDEYWSFKYSTDGGDTYTDFSDEYQKGNSTNHFVAPKLNDNGTYDYTFYQTEAGTGGSYAYTRVYHSVDKGITAGGAAEAVGKWWMRPGNTPNSSVAKVFTAPYTGKITISAKDESGYANIYCRKINNATTAGPVLSIVKAGENLWTNTQNYTNTTKTTEVKTINFDDIGVEVDKGDKIYFVVSSNDTAGLFTKYVYWNPVVEYNYVPESIFPEERGAVSTDTEFVITFPDELEALTKENISITSDNSTPTVKDFEHNGNILSMTFDGLKGETTYSVTVSGIRILGAEKEYIYTFEFTTEYVFEYPVYNSFDAWPDSLTNATMKNDNAVWQWLYRNTLTMDTINPYVPYSLTAENNTDIYVPPIVKDGEYDYTHTGAKGEKSRVYCDSQDNGYMRNTMGKYWSRLSVGTTTEPKQNANNEIVKQFTAPESGKISLSCVDMDGLAKIYNRNLTANNPYGAVVKIIKKSSDISEEDTELWRHEFKYTSETVPSNALAVIDFESIETDITKGEKIWFVISGELGQSAYAKQVFWTPVVAYAEMTPNLVSTNPANNADDIAPNYTHRITFDHDIELPDAGDVDISGGAQVKDMYIENGNTLCISFDKLSSYTKYDVKLHNITIENVTNANENVYEYSFTTGSFVEFGDVKIDGGALKVGENIISVDINNAEESTKPYKAVLAAFVCRGTTDNYEVVSAKYVCSDSIVENDSLSLNINLEQKTGYFVKVMLAESMASAKALLPLKIFN